MNKKYMYLKDYIVVETDEGLEKRKKSNNIIEILKSENNIEEIKNFSNNFTSFEYILNHILDNYIDKAITVAMIIALLITFIAAITNVLPVAIALLVIGVTTALATTASSLVALKDSIKVHREVGDKQKEILNSELEKENKKIKKLVREAKIYKQYDLDKIDKIQKIDRTELITELKRKLELITEYQLNKNEYLKLLKNDALTNHFENNKYSEFDIEFLQMLIQEDLKIDNENKKQKTLKLEKK